MKTWRNKNWRSKEDKIKLNGNNNNTNKYAYMHEESRQARLDSAALKHPLEIKVAKIKNKNNKNIHMYMHLYISMLYAAPKARASVFVTVVDFCASHSCNNDSANGDTVKLLSLQYAHSKSQRGGYFCLTLNFVFVSVFFLFFSIILFFDLLEFSLLGHNT